MPKYTYDLVGLNKQVTVEAKDQRHAVQKAWATLNSYEQEEVEWYDLVNVDGDEPPYQGLNDFWVGSATPFYALCHAIRGAFKK